MKAVFDPRQMAHDPQCFMAQGQRRPSPEQPARADKLLAGAQAAGCECVTPSDFGLSPIAKVHTPEYIAFLQTIHSAWTAMSGAADEVIPNIHPRNRDDSYPTSPVGLAGYHQGDTACPIGAQTWQAAYWSAQCALTAAQSVLDGVPAYALCRPPGHHAYQDQAGGFCFLNNSAIAAQYLADHGRRVAILDVDVHHGNGTQGIFYHRSDILTVSVHADPTGFYPFFYGHAAERGAGAGLGYNLNLPLPFGSGDAEFLAAVDQALARIAAFGADIIVIALGLDAHENDPFRALSVTTAGFGRIASAIAAAGLPLVPVQEGGYLSDDLGPNLTSFLSGL